MSILYRLLVGFSFLALMARASLAAEGKPSEPLFIRRGSLQRGLREHVVKPSWLVPQEEVEITEKVEEQEDCETLPGAFGTEKFNWLTPEDLGERVSFQMKQSGSFEEVELSLEKSELKNHVHVILTAKPKSKYIYNFSDQFRLYYSSNSLGPVLGQVSLII